MPGRHHVGAHFLRDAQEGVELDLAVAEHVRIGGPALGILVEHVVDHPLTVFLAQIDKIKGNAYLAGHHLGHELVFFPLTIPMQRRIGIMPVLHEHCKNVVALLFEKQSGDAGVYTSG